MSKIIDLVEKEVAPLIADNDAELVYAEYVKEQGKTYLRLYVDQQPNGIDLNKISELSELVSEKLDSLEPDPFPDPYVLELSSPGLERPLKKPADWERARGKFVHVSLYQTIAGSKQFEGYLQSFDDTQLTLKIKVKTRAKDVVLPRKAVAKIRFAIDF
ncbi:MAG: ribosome maturation factor RimP [Lactobacillus sp.]